MRVERDDPVTCARVLFDGEDPRRASRAYSSDELRCLGPLTRPQRHGRNREGGSARVETLQRPAAVDDKETWDSVAELAEHGMVREQAKLRRRVKSSKMRTKCWISAHRRERKIEHMRVTVGLRDRECGLPNDGRRPHAEQADVRWRRVASDDLGHSVRGADELERAAIRGDRDKLARAITILVEGDEAARNRASLTGCIVDGRCHFVVRELPQHRRRAIALEPPRGERARLVGQERLRGARKDRRDPAR